MNQTQQDEDRWLKESVAHSGPTMFLRLFFVSFLYFSYISSSDVPSLSRETLQHVRDVTQLSRKSVIWLLALRTGLKPVQLLVFIKKIGKQRRNSSAELSVSKNPPTRCPPQPNSAGGGQCWISLGCYTSMTLGTVLTWCTSRMFNIQIAPKNSNHHEQHWIQISRLPLCSLPMVYRVNI